MINTLYYLLLGSAGGFALLAIVDGLWLHLIRFRLYRYPESRTEHLTHSFRALLFPMIIWSFYLDAGVSPYLGLLWVLIDLLVLGWDAFLEKDSRRFMGGLPRWEYILHLMVNGFHFTVTALVLALRWREEGLVVLPAAAAREWYDTAMYQLLPGAILMAVLHFLLMIPACAKLWESWLNRFANASKLGKHEMSGEMGK